MKRALKIIVPILLILAVIISVGWYFIQYDPGFTRDVLLSQARQADKSGNRELSTWLYNLAYKQSDEDESVAIELAEQFKLAGNYTKAEYTLSNAIADGGSADLYIALCKTYIEQDKLLDAVTMLDNIADPTIKAQLDAIRPAAPTAAPAQGYYNQYISVALSSDGGNIYTATDGEYPSTNSTPYSDPMNLPGGETTIYALVIGENGLISPLSIMGYTVAGVIEEVTLTDPAIDAAVRQVLQVDADHALYSNELWTITELTVPTEAATLSDLSLMPFLEKLTVQGCSIDSFSSLSSLTSLKELVIVDTPLTGDDLKTIAALPKLTSLTAAACRLSAITPLSAATELTFLDISNNTIRDLSALSSMSKLEYLDLCQNAVAELTALSGLTKLNFLDVSYNSIASAAPLGSCAALTQLNIDHNSLATLEGLENLPSLTHLSATHNALATVSNLSTVTTLKELDISNNTLTDITALNTLEQLQTLNFSHNQVTALPAFSKTCGLVTIDGTQNQLTALDELQGLEKLNCVLMDYNPGITTITPLTHCTHLIEVNVYGTGVTEVSALLDMGVVVKYSPVEIPEA